MIFSLRARSHVVCEDFYTLPYIRAHILGVGLSNAGKCNFQCRKESYHVLDHLICDRYWMAVGWSLDRSIFTSYLYDLVLETNTIRQYFSWFNFLWVDWNIESDNLPDKVMNMWIFTIWLTLSGCQPHTSSIWPWSGMPKVHLYNTFLGSLRHLPPQMKNQHGLNEEKNYIGKKIVSHLSACDVARVVSLDTKNLKCKSLWEWKKLVFT